MARRVWINPAAPGIRRGGGLQRAAAEREARELNGRSTGAEHPDPTTDTESVRVDPNRRASHSWLQVSAAERLRLPTAIPVVSLVRPDPVITGVAWSNRHRVRAVTTEY